MVAKSHSWFLSLPLFVILLVSSLSSCANGASIATYWGQNKGEGKLAKACATGNYNYINIAFLATFGSGQAPVVNLPGHCNTTCCGCCMRRLAREIRYCQKWGIKIMLSLGGETGQQSLNSTDDARQVAEYLYNNFLGGRSSSPRPFGSGAVLDGVDFSIVGKTWKDRMHWEDLAIALANYSTPKRKVYLTAAPQCNFPDKTLKKALGTGLFDIVWIRFYNQASCQYTSDGLGPLMLSWAKWNDEVQVSKLFIGLPASGEAAENGYVPPGNLTADVLPFISNFTKYGGVMLWDRYYDMKSKYSERVKLDVMAGDAKSFI